MGNFQNYSAGIQKLLQNIESTVSKEIIINTDDSALIEYPKQASWGSITLDMASGGGTPKGRMIEVFGWESSGKTTIAIHALVEIQKRGGVVAIVDMEQALSFGYLKSLGLDLEKAIIIQPDSAEQALNCVEMLVNSDEIDGVVLDSVAALVAESELEGESGDLKVGLVARLMSQHCRKVSPSVRKTGCTVIYINQFREKINTSGFAFGDNKTLTGGNALKYYCAQRLEVKRVGRIDGGDKEYTGNEIEVEFKKNKLFPPFKKAYFTIIYGKGISRESEIINACLEAELIIKTGSGPAPNFETPIWNGAIDTTEAKVIEALGTEDFKDLYFELNQRLELYLGNITQEEFDNLLKPLYEKYSKSNEDFIKLMEFANLYSGKSKYLESRFYAQEALRIRPLDKTAKKKFDDMNKKVREKMNNFSGDIQFEDKIMSVEKGEVVNVEVITNESK